MQPALACDVYLVMRGAKTQAIAQRLAESLRDQMPQLNLQVQAGGGSFKSQMRRADKSGAKLALILGETEVEAGTVSVKLLREDLPQQEVSLEQLPGQLSQMLN